MNNNKMRTRNLFLSGIVLVALACSMTVAGSPAVFVAPSVDHPRDGEVLAPGSLTPPGFAELQVRERGVLGTYEFNGSRVSIETRRGPRTPRLLRATNPGTPEFEVDVRFLDEHGVPFLVQVGGHAPIDESWSVQQSLVPDDVTEEKAHQRFGTAATMIATLRNARFRADLAPEYEAITKLAPLAASLQASTKFEEASTLATCNYRNKVEIHDQPCCYGFGRHSATFAQNVSNTGATTFAWATCNHGTCAQSMPLKCQFTSSADRCQLAAAPMCSTPYNAFSSSGGHNCNDDTLIQYSSVRYNYCPAPTLGTCSDPYRNDQPTSCF